MFYLIPGNTWERRGGNVISVSQVRDFILLLFFLENNLCWKCQSKIGTFLHVTWGGKLVYLFWEKVLEHISKWPSVAVPVSPRLCLLGGPIRCTKYIQIWAGKFQRSGWSQLLKQSSDYGSAQSLQMFKNWCNASCWLELSKLRKM